MTLYSKLKSKIGAALVALSSLFFTGALYAQATVPTVVQDAVDTKTAEMEVTGYALLGVLVVILGFVWLRRVMK